MNQHISENIIISLTELLYSAMSDSQKMQSIREFISTNMSRRQLPAKVKELVSEEAMVYREVGDEHLQMMSDQRRLAKLQQIYTREHLQMTN